MENEPMKVEEKSDDIVVTKEELGYHLSALRDAPKDFQQDALEEIKKRISEGSEVIDNQESLNIQWGPDYKESGNNFGSGLVYFQLEALNENQKEEKRWRLPTKEELVKAFEEKVPNFKGGIYWSESIGGGSHKYAVDMTDGTVKNFKVTNFADYTVNNFPEGSPTRIRLVR